MKGSTFQAERPAKGLKLTPEDISQEFSVFSSFRGRLEVFKQEWRSPFIILHLKNMYFMLILLKNKCLHQKFKNRNVLIQHTHGMENLS